MSNTAIKEVEASTGIAEFSQFESDLAEYKAKYDGVVYDFADKKQEKQARSDRLAIGKTISKLDSVHKDIKAPLLEQVKLLDGERKRIKDDLTAVQDGIKQQIKEHEAKLQDIEDALQARVREISNLAVFSGDTPSSADIRKRLEAAETISVDESFKHHEQTAFDAMNLSLSTLNNMLLDAERREAQEAENARLKAELAAKEQQERDERIAREAAAAAERKALEAEAREKQAKDDADAAKAEAAKAAEEAEQRAKEAEQRAADAEKKAQADAEKRQQEEAQRQAEEQAAREADKEHRVAINRAALNALMEHAELDDVHGKAVVIAIAEGKIPAVTISY